MTTKKTISHSQTTSNESAVAHPPSPAPAPAPAGAGTPGGTGDPTLLFLSPPPASAHIPPVPAGFVPQSGADYRGTTPKKAELVALPLAVSDLRKFTDFDKVIGSTAPPYVEVLQLFDVTNQWSSMRTSSRAWDVYSVDQEGICWRAMRGVMDRLKPAFELSATGDPSLLTKFAGLATFLGAKQAIAKKAVATKRLNKQAVAEGRAPTHGKVGKQRKKAAAKAIVAAATGAGAGAATHAPSPAPAGGVAAVPTPPANTAPAAAPAASPVAPALVNGVTNGAAH